MNKDKKPLSETHPELAEEAFGWDPSQVLSESHEKIACKCQKIMKVSRIEPESSKHGGQ